MLLRGCCACTRQALLRQWDLALCGGGVAVSSEAAAVSPRRAGAVVSGAATGSGLNKSSALLQKRRVSAMPAPAGNRRRTVLPPSSVPTRVGGGQRCPSVNADLMAYLAVHTDSLLTPATLEYEPVLHCHPFLSPSSRARPDAPLLLPSLPCPPVTLFAFECKPWLLSPATAAILPALPPSLRWDFPRSCPPLTH
jgi:hypothetical protein